MYKIQLSGVIMIGSITLKCRFGEKLWSNGGCKAPQLKKGAASSVCLPIYFNLANAM